MRKRLSGVQEKGKKGRGNWMAECAKKRKKAQIGEGVDRAGAQKSDFELNRRLRKTRQDWEWKSGRN